MANSSASIAAATPLSPLKSPVASARATTSSVVHAIDELRSGLQPGGKQSYGKSEGCVYTRTTGIWQAVWLEAVGQTYLSEFTLTPDLDGGRILLQGSLDGPGKGVKLRVRPTPRASGR